MSQPDDLPPLPGDIPPGVTMPVAWVLFALFVTCAGGGLVGWQAYGSESAGVAAASWTSWLLGFAVSGAVSGLATHFLIRKSAGWRLLVPLGCGCLGSLACGGGLMFFLYAIFPSL